MLFFLQSISELVALLSELGRRVKTLELDLDLETIKATFSQNAEELAKSHEERCALEGELDQIRNVASSSSWRSSGRRQALARPLSSWRRSQMRSGTLSRAGCSTERQGC